MNKVISYLGDGVYAESLPDTNEAKLYTDNGAAQGNIIWFNEETLAALRKFLHDISCDESNPTTNP